MTYWLTVVLPVAAFLLFAFILWRGQTQDWRPLDLKEGKVVMVEDNLYVEHPYRIIGRPDQVVKRADGVHIPVDAKNRDAYRVYATDIAELSLQAWMLRRHGLKTALHGYLAVTNRLTGQRKALRVTLGDDRYCENLIERYIILMEGRVPARRMSGRKCLSCGQRDRC